MTPSWNTPMAGCGSMEPASWRSQRSTATSSAKNIQRGAVIANRFETTLLEDVSGDIRLTSRSGRIVLRRATAGNVVIENSFADIVLTDFSAANLDVLLKNGNLDLRVKNVTERINVEAEHAELDLVFAALADPTFNIKTRNGRIEAQPILGLETFRGKRGKLCQPRRGKAGDPHPRYLRHGAGEDRGVRLIFPCVWGIFVFRWKKSSPCRTC